MIFHSNIVAEKKSLTYVLSVFFATTAALFLIFSFLSGEVPIWYIVITVLLYFAFTLYNAESVMGMRNAIIFKIIALIITFSGEAVGVNFGWIFGSYHYTGMLGPEVLGVPVVVILVWDIYIYAAYMLVSHIVNIRLDKKTTLWRKMWVSFFVAVLTGLATTAHDLIIDPIAVSKGWWVWHYPGAYFPEIAGGVPISNFFGWVFLSALSVFIFKVFFEQAFVEKETVYEWASMVPYFATFFAMVYLGTVMGLSGPVFVGGFAMLIFILFVILLVAKRRLSLLDMED